MSYASVLFRSCRNLANVSASAIRVGTIETIETFQQIEVCQVAAIKDNVVCAGRFRDSIDRNAYRLVGGYEQVKQHEWNDHQIN